MIHDSLGTMDPSLDQMPFWGFLRHYGDTLQQYPDTLNLSNTQGPQPPSSLCLETDPWPLPTTHTAFRVYLCYGMGQYFISFCE